MQTDFVVQAAEHTMKLFVEFKLKGYCRRSKQVVLHINILETSKARQLYRAEFGIVDHVALMEEITAHESQFVSLDRVHRV